MERGRQQGAGNRGKRMTRRVFAGSGLAVLGAAWAGGRALGQDATPASSPVASPVADGVFPRTVQALNGAVTIPAKPTRIVATSDWYELDTLLAVGVPPIQYGYTNRYGNGVAPWTTAAGEAGIPRVDLEHLEFGSLDLEQIAAAKPDLIIADPFWSEKSVKQLEEIAPTVVIPTPYTDENDWRVTQSLVAAAVGEEAAGERAIAETERVIAEQRAAMTPFAERTATVATLYDKAGPLFVSGVQSQEAAALADIGIQTVWDGDPLEDQLSLEQANRLQNVDILVSLGIDPAGIAEMNTNPLFAGIPAIREKRWAVLSPLLGRAIFAPTTLGVRWAAPELAQAITAAAEGKGGPTTS